MIFKKSKNVRIPRKMVFKSRYWYASLWLRTTVLKESECTPLFCPDKSIFERKTKSPEQIFRGLHSVQVIVGTHNTFSFKFNKYGLFEDYYFRFDRI